MVLAFLLVFFGIRSYRENVGNGSISFGRALSVGLLIMLISLRLLCRHVGDHLFHTFMPDFAEKYAAYAVEKSRASGRVAAADRHSKSRR